MAEFTVEFVPAATRDLDRLGGAVQKHLLDAIQRYLLDNPFPRSKQIKRLKGFKIPTYELRIHVLGTNYRVVYRIDGRRVVVLAVPSRALLERYLKRLK